MDASTAISTTTTIWNSVVSGVVVGIIVVVASYFINKQQKVDELPEKYATKTDVNDVEVQVGKIREKMDSYLSKESCKAIREDCIGRNWVEAVKRLEDVFTRKFDELNTLLLSIMRDIGYSKGKQDTKDKD